VCVQNYKITTTNYKVPPWGPGMLNIDDTYYKITTTNYRVPPPGLGMSNIDCQTYVGAKKMKN